MADTLRTIRHGPHHVDESTCGGGHTPVREHQKRASVDFIIIPYVSWFSWILRLYIEAVFVAAFSESHVFRST